MNYLIFNRQKFTAKFVCGVVRYGTAEKNHYERKIFNEVKIKAFVYFNAVLDVNFVCNRYSGICIATGKLSPELDNL